jgi:glyoxylase-like metal-dependent hydrolase (beta-lactamase superfamily II)
MARGAGLCQHLRMTTEIQRWKVGNATITSVVEDETHHIPPEFFFPAATAAEVAEHPWLVPDFADEHGNIALRVQAFVVEIGLRRILVDPCVGNGKTRPIPFWNEMTWPFFERFTDSGFDAAGIDTVVHTHLHADHVGWDTHLVDGEWVPTFTNARHLYTERELAYCKAGGNPGIDGVYADTVAPIVDAGLADIVAEDADLGDGLQLEPSTGHTPGHVSMWIESSGERALVTGDFLHHPVQCEVPEWAEIGDDDAEAARATRRRMLARAAETGALVLGTHFSTRPAGHVVAHGDAWRFVPE